MMKKLQPSRSRCPCSADRRPSPRGRPRTTPTPRRRPTRARAADKTARRQRPTPNGATAGMAPTKPLPHAPPSIWPSCAPSTIGCATSCSARAPAPSWSKRGSTPRSWGSRCAGRGRPTSSSTAPRSGSTATPSGTRAKSRWSTSSSRSPSGPSNPARTRSREARGAPRQERREGACRPRIRVGADLRGQRPRRQDDHRRADRR